MPYIKWSIKRYPSHTLLWLATLSLVVAALVIGVVGAHGSVTRAFSLAATQQPERYTELYFNDPGHLPSYAPTKKVQTVPFTLANHTAQTRLYTYQIITTIGGVTSTTTHQISLANNQSAKLTAQFVVPKPLTPASLLIKLLGTHQQLTLKSTS